MGFTPRQVDEMTLWEWIACVDGYAEAHGIKKKRREITDEEYQKLCDLGDRMNEVANARK